MICTCEACLLLYSLHVFELWGIRCCGILLKFFSVGIFCV